MGVDKSTAKTALSTGRTKPREFKNKDVIRGEKIKARKDRKDAKKKVKRGKESEE